MTDRSPGAPAAVFFFTHRFDRTTADRYRRLVRELPDRHDAFLAYDVGGGDSAGAERARALAGAETFHGFNAEQLRREAGRKEPWKEGPGLVPGDVDLLWTDVRRRHGGYERYWLIEYDVVYTGRWSSFFRHFVDSDADLLGTTLFEHRFRPDWTWWSSLVAGDGAPLPKRRRVRGFFPVAGMSARGLDALARAHDRGWTGHFEVLGPTVLNEWGLEIEDVGGQGAFVREGNAGRFYTNTPSRSGLAPGTFVYRPSRPRPGFRRGKLWHPVKPDCGRLLPYLRLARSWLEARLT